MEHITFVPTELAKQVENLEKANRLLRLENQSLRQQLQQAQAAPVRPVETTHFN